MNAVTHTNRNTIVDTNEAKNGGNNTQEDWHTHTIGIIGLGLIGGAIAYKLKLICPDIRIIGSDTQVEAVREAFRKGIIDNPDPACLSDYGSCDYIFLCTPVQDNIACLSQLKSIIKKGCLITDVGSTKTAIHKEVIRLDMEADFIGGHPMTGSEKTGIANANPDLFENAYYIITPSGTVSPETTERFQSLVHSLGAIPLVMDYESHDRATASISHLPHLIAFSLVNLIQKKDDEDETMKTIAAGGFCDITRIASSSPVMWESICMSNRDPILSICDQYLLELKKLRDSIAQGNSENIRSYFQEAKDYRDSILLSSNKRTTIHELYMDLKDEAGGIAAISCILALKGINIKNIGIVHNREFEEGVLHIEFYDKPALEYAKQLLMSHNYPIYERS